MDTTQMIKQLELQLQEEARLRVAGDASTNSRVDQHDIRHTDHDTRLTRMEGIVTKILYVAIALVLGQGGEGAMVLLQKIFAVL